jgi:hypothetical protein
MAPFAFLAASADLVRSDQPTLLLGQGRIEVQHERISVTTKFRNDEGHALRHQARHERYVAGQPVKLGNDNAALRSLCSGQRSGELRPTVQSVSPLPGFGLDVLGDDGEAFRLGEASNRSSLGFDAEARALLPLR